MTPPDLAQAIQDEQDAPPAVVTVTYASGKAYRFQVADETNADKLRGLFKIHRDFTLLP